MNRPSNVIIEEATLTVVSFMFEEPVVEGLAATQVTSTWDASSVETNFPTFDTDPHGLRLLRDFL